MIAFGARCTWWDDKTNAGSKDGTPTGLPCCPHCGGVLFEIEEPKWWADVDRIDPTPSADSGYRRFVEWMRGKCYPTQRVALEAWVVSRFAGSDGP